MKFEDPSNVKTTGGAGIVVGFSEWLVVFPEWLVVGSSEWLVAGFLEGLVVVTISPVVGVTGGAISKGDLRGVSRGLGDDMA